MCLFIFCAFWMSGIEDKACSWMVVRFEIREKIKANDYAGSGIRGVKGGLDLKGRRSLPAGEAGDIPDCKAADLEVGFSAVFESDTDRYILPMVILIDERRRP